MIVARRPGPDFTRLVAGRRRFYLRRDLAGSAGAILSAIDAVMRSGAKGKGNRSSGFAVNLDGVPPLFARRSRRGGMMWFLGDIHIEFAPRVVNELAVTEEALRRGVPVPEPIGAIVERLMPGVHRGTMITRALNGMTLWEFVHTDDDPEVRSHVFRLARHAIDKMHAAGVFHADLNLHNIFVTPAGESFSIVLLDLDKARLYRRAIPKFMRARNLARLARSVRKLDPHGRYFDNPAMATLTAI